MDAAGIVQETLHSINSKKLSAMILKLDLEKAYDKVDQTFLHLILVQIGLPLNIVRLILSFFCMTSFVVLINETPTAFLHSSRGLRQGFPLSPYLFSLVIEGLNLLFDKANAEGTIKGVKVAGGLFITHTFFVDDVIIFGSKSIKEWQRIKCLIDLFCKAYGMSISAHKSCFRVCNVHEDSMVIISQLFQIGI